MAEVLWKALSEIKWTPKTGGTIYGDDMANRENEDSSPYLLMSYGPLGEDRRLKDIDFRVSQRV